MTIETATYVGSLNSAYPAAADPKSEGDNHIRLLKDVLLNSFAGFAGLILVTGTEAQGATVNDYTVTVSPAPSAYTSSMVVVFKATHTNTGAATLQVNALGTKTLLDINGDAINSGTIQSGSAVVAACDGTNFYLLSGNGLQTARTPSVGDNSERICTTEFANTLAFAAALPAQSGNSGKFVTTNGTSASWGNPIAVNSTPKTAGYTAVAGDTYSQDSSAGGFTVTLPASPAVGDAPILLHDAAGTWASNNVLLDPGANNIKGVSGVMACDINNFSAWAVWAGSTYGWTFL